MIKKKYVDYFYLWYLDYMDIGRIDGVGGMLAMSNDFVFPDGEVMVTGQLLNEVMRNPDLYPLVEEDK